MKFNVNDFNKIEGWCDNGIVGLYSQMVYTHDNAIFVEVGSWKGKSSFCMGSLIKECNKNIKFYCVDIWKSSSGYEQDADAINDSLFDVFKKNTEIVKDYIFPMQMTSLEASKKFDDNSLDFIFIDAAHDYENVKNDINIWYPKLKNGGTLAGHDYHPTLDGVVRAVNEWALAGSKLVRVDATTWIHHKISSN